jgi:NCS1 family nucleobase:cation symporter-1
MSLVDENTRVELVTQTDFSIEQAPISEELKPIPDEKRHVKVISYMAMWAGDAFNISNITLGSSLVVAGIAVMNLYQTMLAAVIAIAIVSVIFALNDRFGYITGAPYVMQLRLSFGRKGAKAASLLRGIPAVVWFGFQSWSGALALNQVLKILTHNSFSNVPVCFVVVLVLEVLVALKGFQSIKVLATVVSAFVMVALLSVFTILVTKYPNVIAAKFVHVHGTWGLTFFGFIVAFLGNYTTIFESAADYSRELRPHLSNSKRCFLYFIPILFAYGITLLTGAMLAIATGISSPVNAMAHIFQNNSVTLFVSIFIVVGCITSNMVANIMPPTYVLTSLFKMPQKVALAMVALLCIATCPWLLVQNTSSMGLALFIKIYSIFLGPMTAVILLEYYVERHQRVDMLNLYNDAAQKDVHWNAPIALFVGAAFAVLNVNLSWIIGFVVSGIVYYFINKVHVEDRAIPKA